MTAYLIAQALSWLAVTAVAGGILFIVATDHPSPLTHTQRIHWTLILAFCAAQVIAPIWLLIG